MFIVFLIYPGDTIATTRRTQVVFKAVEQMIAWLVKPNTHEGSFVKGITYMGLPLDHFYTESLTEKGVL